MGQIVALWLEKVYAFSASPPVCEPAMGKHTLRHLTTMGPSTRLVSELDPDAAERQKRTWAEPDTANESLLLSGVWQYLRMGQVTAAQELCRRCQQPWRAASLGGVYAFSDPLVGTLRPGTANRRSGEARPFAHRFGVRGWGRCSFGRAARARAARTAGQSVPSGVEAVVQSRRRGTLDPFFFVVGGRQAVPNA